MAHFDGKQQHFIERIEDGNLEQDRRATRERIDLFGFVERHDFLLLARLVFLVAFLDCLHLRLNDAHGGHGRELFLGDGEHQATHRDGQQDDREPEIAGDAEQPVEIFEDRLFDEFEPTPVDCFAEMGDAKLVLIRVEDVGFLRPGKEMRFDDFLLARRDGGGGERIVGLIGVARSAKAGVDTCVLWRDERSQPEMVAEAHPAAL